MPDSPLNAEQVNTLFEAIIGKPQPGSLEFYWLTHRQQLQQAKAQHLDAITQHLQRQFRRKASN